MPNNYGFASMGGPGRMNDPLHGQTVEEVNKGMAEAWTKGWRPDPGTINWAGTTLQTPTGVLTGQNALNFMSANPGGNSTTPASQPASTPPASTSPYSGANNYSLTPQPNFSTPSSGSIYDPSNDPWGLNEYLNLGNLNPAGGTGKGNQFFNQQWFA